MITYPVQYIYVIGSLVVGISVLYASSVTATGPDGAVTYTVDPPNFAIQPGWKVTLDTLNNPSFSAP